MDPEQLEGNEDAVQKTPMERQKETQVAQLVLEEVIEQRNTLMNEVASLHVQLKVTQKRCELLEKDRDQLLQKGETK